MRYFLCSMIGMNSDHRFQFTTLYFFSEKFPTVRDLTIGAEEGGCFDSVVLNLSELSEEDFCQLVSAQ